MVVGKNLALTIEVSGHWLEYNALIRNKTCEIDNLLIASNLGGTEKASFLNGIFNKYFSESKYANKVEEEVWQKQGDSWDTIYTSHTHSNI